MHLLNSQNRFISLEGSMNFRDFGGYATADGLVAKGKLFRCGSLANIPERAHAVFAALDIGVICDLPPRRRDRTWTNTDNGTLQGQGAYSYCARKLTTIDVKFSGLEPNPS